MLWAGTSPDFPAVLDGWEVERIMEFLSSSDSAIRSKVGYLVLFNFASHIFISNFQTLRVLLGIDGSIVNAYFAQTLQHIAQLSLTDPAESAAHLIEVAEALSSSDGERYAVSVREILTAAGDRPDVQSGRVLELVVEKVLAFIRDSKLCPVSLSRPLNLHRISDDEIFGSNAATTLLAPLAESGAQHGSTFMVIVTALVCEYVGRVAVPPQSLLQSLAGSLPFYTGEHPRTGAEMLTEGRYKRPYRRPVYLP